MARHPNMTIVAALGPEYVLETDSQDVQATLESIGKLETCAAYTTLFVLIGDAEILEVYGVVGIPYLSKLTSLLYRASE